MTAVRASVPPGLGWRSRLALPLLTLIIVGAAGGAAWAYWLAVSATGGSGASAATSVNAGATPTASADGSTVTVTWSASTLATGHAVDGYLVNRYNASTLAAQPMLAACAGTVSGTSCIESAVPDGSWRYTVTPVFASNWRGAESGMGNTVVVGAPDTTGPSGGSVDASGLGGTGARYSTFTPISIILQKGSDPSGVAATGAQLSRATATLTNGSCGAYGAYGLVADGTDPGSPKSDSVGDQACYRYRYLVHDTLGNATTYTSGDIKVDTTAPSAPSLAFSAFTNSYWSGSGTTVYYRSAAGTGAFTATATATDAASGIASYAYPPLGTNWTSTAGSLGVTTYSWSGAPAAPGTKDVTATSNAGTVSADAPFTPTADDAPPTVGTVTYADGSTGGNAVSVSFTTGTDAASGIGTRLLQRAIAPATGSTCGSYGTFTTVAGGTNPVSPVLDTLPADSCAKYQYVVSDNVGNTHTATSSSVAHVPFGAYWAFDAGTGTTATDSTGNENTGTLQAAAAWTTGKIGANALNLDGTSTSFMDVAEPVIDTAQSYTVAAWVKLNVVSGYQTITAIDGASINPFSLQMGPSASGTEWVLRFTQSATDATGASSATVYGPVPSANTWYHVAGVYDTTAGTVEFFVDGVSQGTAVSAGAWTAAGHTTIGRALSGGASAEFLNGAIDEVRYYDRVLSASEIETLARTYTDTVRASSGLVSYWRLGEASAASPMDDDTATGNDGTYVNTPTVGVTGAVPNDPNTAVRFDGVDDYATAARQISTDFSIEFWFKSTQNFSNDFGQPSCTQWWQGASLVDADFSGSGDDFGISLCSGKLIAGVGSPDVSIVTAGTYNSGAWHHVVFTRTQSTGAMTLYVDGASVGTATGSLNALTSTATINFGRSAAAVNYFAGTLDEIAFYNTALTLATVQSHYAAAQ